MLTKELADLVAQTALNLSERPVPTAAEILSALNRIAEKADAIGFARGVVTGSNHTAQVMNRTLLAMSRP